MPIRLPERDPCPFCENLAGRRDCAFIERRPLVSSFMNPRQIERGAVLVITNRHVPTIFEATRDELMTVADLVGRLAHALDAVFQPVALNVFQNNGVTAGQTVPHYHVHVVPRYATSDPTRIFRSSEVAPTALGELGELARLIRNGPTMRSQVL